MSAVGDVSERAELARWRWKAQRARQLLVKTFVDHHHDLRGDWCDFEESSQLTADCRGIGTSAGRVIQLWPTKKQFVDAVGTCDLAGMQRDAILVLLMDAPDAGWIRMSLDHVLADLVPMAGEWMTDGFIMFDPASSSLISIDVEDRRGVSVIETTLIGDGFSHLRSCLERFGPAPLPVTGPERDR